MAEPERRRRRPAVSCNLCRKRKIRCNRETPCSNCVRSRHDNCVYENSPSSPLSPSRHVRHHNGEIFKLGMVSRDSRFSIPLEQASVTSGSSAVFSHPSTSLAATTSSSASTPPSHLSSWDLESMQNRILHLEVQLAKSNRAFESLTQSTALSSAPTQLDVFDTAESSLAGTFHTIQRESQSSRNEQTPASNISRGIVHKSRLFGQSHWINGVALFRDIFDMLEPRMRGDTTVAGFLGGGGKRYMELVEPPFRGNATDASGGIKRCKTLAKMMKKARAPAWPSIPKTDLPAKNIADELVDCYLRTFETVYRVLHVPTFKRDYEALWILPASQEPDAIFLLQLKLILAIGTTMYDEFFSLRTSAVHWIYEAYVWIIAPEFKSRLSIQALQTHLLLLIAREVANVGRDIWIPAGAVLRTAVYMGLHRDPLRLPKRTPFATEMRRRLWNTVLEIALQSSLNIGGPPFIDLADFDTLPPGNFDDEQLVPTTMTMDKEIPISVPKPDDQYSQMSVAIALRKTFPVRLAITKHLNDLGGALSSRDGPESYEKTLRLHDEVKAAYKALCLTFQRYNALSSDNNEAMRAAPSSFTTSIVDFLMCRYLSALHVPYFGPSLYPSTSHKYAFSRQIVVDNSRRIWKVVSEALSLSSPSSTLSSNSNISNHSPLKTISPTSQQTTNTNTNTDLPRLLTNGSGFYRTNSIQAAFLLAVDLRAQFLDDINVSLSSSSFSPSPNNQSDLLSPLDQSVEYQLRCLHCGETNVKGYLFTSVVAAQVKAFARGVTKREDVVEALARAAIGCVETALPIFEEGARKLGLNVDDGGRDGESASRGGTVQGDGGKGVERADVERLQTGMGMGIGVGMDLDGFNDTSPASGEMGEEWDMWMSDSQFTFGFGNLMDPMSWAADEADGLGMGMPIGSSMGTESFTVW